MDFKKLFRKDDKAVSPVIGVILMVAITVILAAAIGSSVFSKGTTESAPQANLDIKSAGVTGADATAIASIRIEHLGGDTIHFEDESKTKMMASLNGADAVEIDAVDLGIFNVGSVKTLVLSDDNTATTPADAFGATDVPKSGDTVNIKIIDVQTNQLICDKDIRL